MSKSIEKVKLRNPRNERLNNAGIHEDFIQTPTNARGGRPANKEEGGVIINWPPKSFLIKKIGGGY